MIALAESLSMQLGILDTRKITAAIAWEMMNVFLLKAVLNVLEFNQNYLFLVSFAVVSFTLVH